MHLLMVKRCICLSGCIFVEDIVNLGLLRVKIIQVYQECSDVLVKGEVNLGLLRV